MTASTGCRDWGYWSRNRSPCRGTKTHAEDLDPNHRPRPSEKAVLFLSSALPERTAVGRLGFRIDPAMKKVLPLLIPHTQSCSGEKTCSACTHFTELTSATSSLPMLRFTGTDSNMPTSAMLLLSGNDTMAFFRPNAGGQRSFSGVAHVKETGLPELMRECRLRSSRPGCRDE